LLVFASIESFATVLVLVFTPALLSAHESFHARLGRWFGRPAAAAG